MEQTIALKLILAAVFGGCVGIERQMRNKPAGLRTNMLVCVGSTLFVIISMQLALVTGGDQTRIAAQIVSGIGFLGAGAVLHARGLVLGLTTAATIWVVAGIGMAVGSGFYTTGLIATILSVATLTLMSYVEMRLRGHQPHGYTLVVTNLGPGLKVINEALQKLSIPPATFSFKKEPGRTQVWFSLIISHDRHLLFIDELARIPEVTEVEAGALGQELLASLRPGDGEHPE